MRSFRLLVPLCLVIVSSAASGTAIGDMSWGKVGVSLEQYARDTNECADTSRTVTLAIKPDTLRTLDALSSTALLDIALQSSQSPDFNPMMFASGITKLKTSNDVARRTTPSVRDMWR